MASTAPRDRQSARIAIVEQHVQFGNEHNLDGVLATFGESARYEDEAWGDEYHGRDGVQSFYKQLMTALPDLHIQVQRRHASDDAILLEVMITGTPWVHGAVFHRPEGTFASRFAVFTASTTTTVSREREFTTIEPPSSDSSECFTSRRVYWEELRSSQLIR